MAHFLQNLFNSKSGAREDLYPAQRYNHPGDDAEGGDEEDGTEDVDDTEEYKPGGTLSTCLRMCTQKISGGIAIRGASSEQGLQHQTTGQRRTN